MQESVRSVISHRALGMTLVGAIVSALVLAACGSSD